MPLNQRPRKTNKSAPKKIWDCIIIGGGPAGLAAGTYLSRMGFKTLLTEAHNLGGQARQLGRIENYPGFPMGVSGKALTNRFIQQGKRWGLEIHRTKISGLKRKQHLFIASAGKSSELSRSVIISIGASFKTLGLPKEKHFRNKGLYYGFIEDGSRWRGKKVTIVGGGDSAFYQALEMARHAQEVHLICRGVAKAARHLIQQAHHKPNIKQHLHSHLMSLIGTSQLRAVIIQKSEESFVLETDALFVLIGKFVNESLWSKLKHSSGVFWAGDTHNGLYRQVAIATGDGIRAAMDSARYIQSLPC